MGNKKKKMIVIKLNPEKEIGFTVTDGATNKVLKTGSSKVKDKIKFSTGGDTMLKGKQKKLDKNKDGKISGEDFKMMKAKDGKSVKTSKTLEKFAGKNTMKDLGQLKAALSEKELDFIKGLNKSKGSMTAKEKEVMNRYKDDVVPNYSKGGAMKKAKYGKMMKASKSSMTSSEGPTNKVRGTGIAVKGTNFKGVF